MAVYQGSVSVHYLEDLVQELNRLEEVLGKEHLELLPALKTCARACHAGGDYAEAEAYYSRALSIVKSQEPLDVEQLIELNHGLGILFRIQDRYAEAESYYLAALELVSRYFADDISRICTRRNYLAGLYFACGNYQLAEYFASLSLAAYEASPESKHLLGPVRLALAIICKKAGKHNFADEHFLFAARYIPQSSPQHYISDIRDLSGSLLSLACDKYRLEKFEESEILFRFSLICEAQEVWPDSPIVAENIHLLGDVYKSFGLQAQAEFLYGRALAIREKSLPAEHLDIASSSHCLGVLLFESMKYGDSARYLERAVRIRSKHGFPPLEANSRRAYAATLRRLGKEAEANEQCRLADEIWARYQPPQ